MVYSRPIEKLGGLSPGKPWTYTTFVRGFRLAYKQRGLYPRGLIEPE